MIVALSKLTELDRIEREAFEAVGYALSLLEQVRWYAAIVLRATLCLPKGVEPNRVVVFPVEDLKPIVKRSSILFLRDVVTQSIRWG